jgi:hypothetical protein
MLNHFPALARLRRSSKAAPASTKAGALGFGRSVPLIRKASSRYFTAQNLIGVRAQLLGTVTTADPTLISHLELTT